MTQYAAEEDGRYPRTSGPDTIESCWSSWGTYGCVTNWNTGGKTIAVGYGLLLKHGYLHSEEQLYCPGRQKESWPASNIFVFPEEAATDDDGDRFPWSTCYNLRGWEAPETQKDWRMSGRGRRAIVADHFSNYWAGIGAHQIGMNVGYSDGSAFSISGNAHFDADSTLFEALKDASFSPYNPISTFDHHKIYRCFDVQ